MHKLRLLLFGSLLKARWMVAVCNWFERLNWLHKYGRLCLAQVFSILKFQARKNLFNFTNFKKWFLFILLLNVINMIFVSWMIKVSQVVNNALILKGPTQFLIRISNANESRQAADRSNVMRYPYALFHLLRFEFPCIAVKSNSHLYP